MTLIDRALAYLIAAILIALPIVCIALLQSPEVRQSRLDGEYNSRMEQGK